MRVVARDFRFGSTGFCCSCRSVECDLSAGFAFSGWLWMVEGSILYHWNCVQFVSCRRDCRGLDITAEKFLAVLVVAGRSAVALYGNQSRLPSLGSEDASVCMISLKWCWELSIGLFPLQLSSPSKLYEHYILSCISLLLATTGNQFGFKPKQGTDMCIFLLLNRLCLIM